MDLPYINHVPQDEALNIEFDGKMMRIGSRARITHMLAKAVRTYREGGHASVLEHIDHTLGWLIFRARLKREDAVSAAFDRRHGTDTASEVDLATTGLSKAAAVRGNHVYRVFWERNFEALFNDLPIDHANYTFVDIGSGKGKLLLLAAHRPFRRVVGIELAPALHRIAEQNIAAYHPPERVCEDVSSVLADALQFELPVGPTVHLMVNPFDTPTIGRVLSRIAESGKGSPHPVFAVYANMRRVAEAGPIFDNIPGLDILVRRRKHIILGNEAAARAISGRRR